MPRATIPLSPIILLAAVPGAAALAQLVVQQQIVVRVQRSVMQPVVWREKMGPKCVTLGSLAGAQLLQPDAVDLVMTGGERLRARLEDDCPALNFYRGFYLKPTKDGKLCADRDAIRSRSGGMCEIAGFRKLVARK